jgi:hypothetical protein
MNVELHIEELVLRGLGGGMQHEIQAAMERELAELLRAEGVASLGSLGQRGDVWQLDAESFHVKSRANGQAIGGQLARSVYRGILG